MVLMDEATIEIEAGGADDTVEEEVYRNLQILYGTHTGEQALDREFGIDANITDYPQMSAQALLAAEIFIQGGAGYAAGFRNLGESNALDAVFNEQPLRGA